MEEGQTSLDSLIQGRINFPRTQEFHLEGGRKIPLELSEGEKPRMSNEPLDLHIECLIMMHKTKTQ